MELLLISLILQFCTVYAEKKQSLENKSSDLTSRKQLAPGQAARRD